MARTGPGRDIRLDTVLGFRASCTVVTSTWADGTHGPIGFSVPPGTLPEAFVQKANASHWGRCHIVVSRSETHFMCADTTIELWNNLYGPAFVLRRQALGLPSDALGMLLADAFTGNHATLAGEALRRAKFFEEFHILGPPQMPGGWSAKGQPCDQLHHVFRAHVDALTDKLLGYTVCLLDRPLFHELEVGSAGTIKRSIKAGLLVGSLIYI